MSLTYGFCLDEPSSMYDSEQFSHAIHAVVGDGVTPQGSRLSLTINGLTATVAPGYALTAGRWLENDEPHALIIKNANNDRDRTDALVVRADYQGRKVFLEVLTDVAKDKLQEDLRNDTEHSIVLYLIRVRRGASSLIPEDVTDTRAYPDLCGAVVPLSHIAGDVLYLYRMLTSGIDAGVARIIALSQAVVDKANAAIPVLDAAIQRAGGGPGIGELTTVRRDPSSGWLLCDGSQIPAQYTELSTLLGGTLPDISQPGGRYRTYIFGGAI